MADERIVQMAIVDVFHIEGSTILCLRSSEAPRLGALATITVDGVELQRVTVGGFVTVARLSIPEHPEHDTIDVWTNPGATLQRSMISGRDAQLRIELVP